MAIVVSDDIDRCLAMTEEAERIGLTAGDDARLAQAWGYAAIGQLRRGRLDEAAGLARRAVDTMLALGDEVGALIAMRVLWVIAWRRGHVEQLRAQATEGAAIEDRHDLDGFATMGRYWLAVLAVLEADNDAALATVDAMLARRGVPAVQQAYQALRSLLLRRAGRMEQAWEELARIQPVGSVVLGVQSMVGPVERGWCEIELGRLDDAWRSFEAARHTVGASDDMQFVAASLEGHAAITFARGSPSEAGALLARADTIRRDAPAILNLHHVEVDRLRWAIAATGERGSEEASGEGDGLELGW